MTRALLGPLPDRQAALQGEASTVAVEMGSRLLHPGDEGGVGGSVFCQYYKWASETSEMKGKVPVPGDMALGKAASHLIRT